MNSQRDSHKWNNWQMSFFFPPHLSIFLFLFCEPGSTEHPDLRSVYLGQESSFMYMTPRQSRRTERGDEGRWLRTPAHSLWGHMHCSPLFFFPPSHTFSLLHSNRLTNVPWKFTLDAGSGEVKKEGGGSWEKVEVWICKRCAHFVFHPESLLTGDVASLLKANGNITEDAEVWLCFRALAVHLLCLLLSLLKLHQHVFFESWSSRPQISQKTHTPRAPAPLPLLLLPRISSSFSAAPLL